MQQLWVGLYDLFHEGVWRWEDGEPVELNASGTPPSAATTAAWAAGQPDNGGDGEDCALLDVDAGTWRDADCRDELAYACAALVVTGFT